MIEKELLLACCMCDKIKVNDNPEKWINEKDDLVLYKNLFSKYNNMNKISHGYCPEDFEKVMADVDDYISTE